MIPVMLFGVLFAKKQYSLQEYLCVALITVGIVTFNLSGKPHNKEVRGVRTNNFLFPSHIVSLVTISISPLFQFVRCTFSGKVLMYSCSGSLC